MREERGGGTSGGTPGKRQWTIEKNLNWSLYVRFKEGGYRMRGQLPERAEYTVREQLFPGFLA
jgi:hypothetical protein